jgi:hypothetical protein
VSGPLGNGPAAGDPAENRLGVNMTFRRPLAKALVILPTGGIGLILLAGVAVGSVWWEKLLLGLLAGGLAAFLARVASLAVIAEPSRLVIRNMRNTHRVGWSEIEAITQPAPIPASVYRENSLARQNMTLEVVLREGAVISATLYDNRMFGHRWGRSAIERMRAIAELQRWLQARRSSP